MAIITVYVAPEDATDLPYFNLIEAFLTAPDGQPRDAQQVLTEMQFQMNTLNPQKTTWGNGYRAVVGEMGDFLSQPDCLNLIEAVINVTAPVQV